MSELRVPDVDRPSVSIVVVTHGAWEWTDRALRAVIEHTPPRYEVVAVDNASSDGTPERLARVAGARVVLNEDNRGFGPAADQGAALARGGALVFLNSDALVHPGWLEPLLETLERDAAAAAPRFLNLDGSLQEAGALVASDGRTAQHGSGDAPDRLEYRFRREVDYAGAACLAVRRADFDAVGGFDPVYGPAYYEDADLCFKLAARGRRTVYEPRSTVTHARYGSGSPELALELTQRNRAVFADRWADELASRPPSVDPGRPRRVLEARDARSLDRHLVVGPAAPLAEALVGLWPSARVTLLGDCEAEPLLRLGVEVAEPDGDVSGWLRRRRFHYDTVMALDRSDLDRVALDAQPQAARIVDPPLDAGGLTALLAEAGVAPP